MLFPFSQVVISQEATSRRLGGAMGGRALRLEHVRGPIHEASSYVLGKFCRLVNCTSVKLPIGKISFESYQLGKCLWESTKLFLRSQKNEIFVNVSFLIYEFLRENLSNMNVHQPSLG